jgi:hypothetical protein
MASLSRIQKTVYFGTASYFASFAIGFGVHAAEAERKQWTKLAKDLEEKRKFRVISSLPPLPPSDELLPSLPKRALIYGAYLVAGGFGGLCVACIFPPLFFYTISIKSWAEMDAEQKVRDWENRLPANPGEIRGPAEGGRTR